jgi:multidrug transporter EmrE-like cation transporter
MFILLAVFTSVLLLVIFKLFDTFKINTFYAIIVNYITAAITGIISSSATYSFNEAFNSSWIKIAFPLGLLFILIFYFISQTAQKISVSTASVANKMSVAMPVLFSVFALNQKIGVINWVGIVLAVVSVYLTTRPNSDASEKKIPKAFIWLPVIVFVGSGLIDICINAANAFYIKHPTDGDLFSITTFLSAFVFGCILSIIGLFIPKLRLAKPLSTKKELWKSILGGVLLGIPNYFSIVFIFKALHTNVLSSAELFPVLNVSNVVLATLIALVFYKERLRLINVLGIIIAIAAIICIAI